ncbi:protein-tyrosine phosphatase family protein [Yoonia sp. R2331]|uniref:phosphatase domain-containing putative toxin n=1 Tax=Yoonia sp. R2331 TaxID=3237238 RepID=UPI0034E3E8BD
MPEFVIHEMQVGGGVLAISPLPGRTRHYYTDWLRLADWGPQVVVSMTEMHELERKGAGTLGADLRNAGVVWRHLPVPDYGTPDAALDAAWPEVQAEVLDTLRQGGRVLVHCFGGCGRSGMVVLRLMIAAGVPDALRVLRRVRPCAVETEDQMAWALQDQAESKG